MNLREIVLTDAIVSGLEATKRDHAIGELLDRLIACGAVPSESRAVLLKDALARERRGSTGFGHGVAVPHTKTSLVTKPIAALGVSQIGVDFSSLDRQPVHSIIFMLSPKDQPESHLAAMETIFGALSQETFRRFLRQARNRDDVLTLLDETDGAANAGSA
jgi:mannitol/fructose-specific phosphotransferase system IIA component (Ntr-type)